jgi:hypothetical protein
VQKTIAVKSIGSVYSFKADGKYNAADTYYSYIHFFVEGTTIALFGAGASDPYDTGWYGNDDLKTSAAPYYQGGSATLRCHTLALPVTNGTQIYATPIGYKDDKTSYFGVMWSTSPTFEQGADYLHVGYIHSGMSSPTVKELATDLMAGAMPVYSYDYTAMVQGWIVGKRLAAMRGKKLPADITDATFENGILYIKNASAVLNGSILEVK